MAAAITGGPVKIEAWLARGSFFRQLCSGAIQNELTVRGSGMLPVSAGDRVVVKWTELSGTAVTVRVDAFVDEETSGENAPGWIDETPRTLYLYQARRINTQDNAGGGALRTRISLATGQVGLLAGMQVVGPASAGSTLVVQVWDEDNSTIGELASIGAGASRIANFPSIGAAPTHNNAVNSQRYILGPGEILVAISSAALQTETLTIGIALLLTEPNTPTWDTTGSAGTPNLAASTISAANTWQIVRYPL